MVGGFGFVLLVDIWCFFVIKVKFSFFLRLWVNVVILFWSDLDIFFLCRVSKKVNFLELVWFCIDIGLLGW